MRIDEKRVILLMMHAKKYPRDTKAGRYLTYLLDQRRLCLIISWNMTIVKQIENVGVRRVLSKVNKSNTKDEYELLNTSHRQVK